MFVCIHSINRLTDCPNEHMVKRTIKPRRPIIIHSQLSDSPSSLGQGE